MTTMRIKLGKIDNLILIELHRLIMHSTILLRIGEADIWAVLLDFGGVVSVISIPVNT